MNTTYWLKSQATMLLTTHSISIKLAFDHTNARFLPYTIFFYQKRNFYRRIAKSKRREQGILKKGKKESKDYQDKIAT